MTSHSNMYKTIEEEGGIQKHIENMGLDFWLFARLHQAGLSNNAIGRALRKPPINGRTIGIWRSKLDASDVSEDN